MFSDTLASFSSHNTCYNNTPIYYFFMKLAQNGPETPIRNSEFWTVTVKITDNQLYILNLLYISFNKIFDRIKYECILNQLVTYS